MTLETSKTLGGLPSYMSTCGAVAPDPGGDHTTGSPRFMCVMLTPHSRPSLARNSKLLLGVRSLRADTRTPLQGGVVRHVKEMRDLGWGQEVLEVPDAFRQNRPLILNERRHRRGVLVRHERRLQLGLGRKDGC
eukprot:scaffold130622_cov54-Phaeocystis_antarctica.AAC.1